MIDIMTLATQVLLLIIMLVPGFLLKKCNLAEEKFAKGLANLILYIAQPAMLIAPYIREFDADILKGMIITTILSFVIHTLFFLIAIITVRGKSISEATLKLAIMFSNCGYMGIPLIKALLGDETAIYATVFNIGFQFCLWTFGCYVATGDKKYISIKKMFLNPSTISIILGIIIFLLPVENYIPEVVKSAIDMLKELVAPLSMMVVGYHAAGVKIKSCVKDGKMWMGIALRLILCPIVVVGFLKLLMITGLFGSDITIPTVILLCSSAPCATITSIFSEKYDLDRAMAGRIVPISTVLALISMPLVSLMLYLL